MVKLPAFQFYPADWLNNIKLQSCSLGAQGLLINLICLMHQAKPYGQLMINGRIPPSITVSNLLRLHHKTYQARLKELLLYGVLYENKNGVICCKRMIKDERIRQVRRESGKLGGNPLLKQEVKQAPKQKSTPSSSSSPSKKKGIIYSEEFLEFYKLYPHKKEKRSAFARWNALKKTGELPSLQILLDGVKKQIDWRKNPGDEFVPEWKYPAVWLNKGCWEDGPTPVQPKREMTHGERIRQQNKEGNF